MKTVGIRALKQNASAVVAEAAAGETIVITDRGRPVAQLVPVPTSPLVELIRSGRARPPKRAVAELPRPMKPRPGQRSSAEVLREMRDDERY